MNKKNFTRLAGLLLLLGVTFFVHAQRMSLTGGGQRLRLDRPVSKLVKGPNPGYYHLKVDSVNFVTGLGTDYGTKAPAGRRLTDTLTLFMSKQQTNQEYKLFLDNLNSATSNPNWVTYFSTNAPKSEASAAALWCTNVNDYEQGQNITYDFINKQQKETLLEVDIFGYHGWAPGADGFQFDNDSNKVPGGVSGWKFSDAYETTLHTKRPLMSYITVDTVAVLCVETGAVKAAAVPGTFDITGHVVVKIASAMDVKNGLVDGVLYFTLTEAKPFVLDQRDYNTMFGTDNTAGGKNLTFSNDVDKQHENYFSKGKLQAMHIPTAGVTATDNIILFSGRTQATLDTLRRPAYYLDTLGYMAVKHPTKGFLSVAHKYYFANAGGDQYLDWTFIPGNKLIGGNTFADSVKLGQSVFRFVYYPSGDSIYINPYQATYYPSYLYNNTNRPAPDSLDSWTDGLVLSYNYLDSTATASSGFTYYADTLSKVNALELGGITAGDPLGWQDTMAARLKYGTENKTLPYLPYSYHHKLYVTIQNLTSETKILTLHQGNASNWKINTQINFGIYRPCGGPTGYVTMDPDLYLIRNAKGQYLGIPLYSATDSAMWIKVEPNVHPELMPCYQWVVEKRYINSSSSSITLTNREFPFINFEVRLKVDHDQPFLFVKDVFEWNKEKINALKTTFSKDDGKATFIALDSKYKKDKLLGYTWIDPDTSVVNLYAFNYLSGVDPTRYIGWNGDLQNYPNTDTIAHVKSKSYFDKMYFKLDTIRDDKTGGLQEYGYKVHNKTQVKDLVTLERQAYRLVHDDPFLYTCKSNMILTNAETDKYAIATRGAYRPYLGRPAFHLRNTYNISGQDYFALVQIIDTTTINPTYPNNVAAFEAFLLKKYGKQLTDIVMNRLKLSSGPTGTSNFNPGLYVANVDESQGFLKAVFRPEGATTISTFKLEKDNNPIYRRFNTEKEGDNPGDVPETVIFHMMDNEAVQLYENTGALAAHNHSWKDGKKNYLGAVNIYDNPTANTAIYVDTAYINRGTGYIKPQYLLMVDPDIVEPSMGCDDYGNPTIPLAGYLRGRYLVNAHDSAHTAQGLNRDYLWDSQWTRLVFTDAIHANDHLYILSGADLEKLDIWGKLKDGAKQIDLKKLDVEAARPGTKIKKVNLGIDNKHKDCVFSFRLIERNGFDFLIESETTNRDFANGPIIRPCDGGWVKIQNYVAMMTPSDEIFNMGNAARFNVKRTDKKPLAKEEVKSSDVKIVGGIGSVSIMNAAGKNVVINNILGQTIVNTVLTSDNATITAPKGIVVVAIEGEAAVKALVK